MVSNWTFLVVVFKWRHGSEGVNPKTHAATPLCGHVKRLRTLVGMGVVLLLQVKQTGQCFVKSKQESEV